MSRLSRSRFTYCLAVVLSIVPLSCVANIGNGKLSLDGYFVHQQSVIQHLERWRAQSVNLRTIRTLNSWSQCIAPAEWGRERACYGKSRSTGCGASVEEMPQSGGNHWRACCTAAEHAILNKVQPSSLRNCSTDADIAYGKISNGTRSLASLRSLMLAAQQLFYHNYVWSVNLSLAICMCVYVNTLVIRFNPGSKSFKFWL